LSEGFRVVVGADRAGYEYKELIKQDLLSDPRVASVVDVGDDINYPSVAIGAANVGAEGKAGRSILICGTGVAIAANKVKGIRAVTALDSYSVERSVSSNKCQVLWMGQRVIGPELARRLAREWLNYTFDPSSASAPKVAEICSYEGL
jgi:ribose 5-phosphate isomerase B